MFLISRSRNAPRQASRLASLYAVLNAGLEAVAGIALQPVIILAAVAFLLGGDNYQIAAFAVIALAGWALAPLLMLVVGSAIGDAYPVVLGAGVIRAIAVIVIGFIGFQIDDMSTSRVVSSLIVAYLVYHVSSAVAAQSTSGVIFAGIPRNQQMMIFRRRGYAAGIAAVIGALACWSVFRSDETFQIAVGLVLMLAAVSLASATWFLLTIRGRATRTSLPQLRQLVSTATSACRGAAFRRYLSYKALLALTAAFDPFVIVFGFQQLGLEVAYLGWAILAFALGQLGGQLLWTRLVARHGARVPFQVAAFFRLLFLTLAISLPTLATSSFYADRFDNLDAAMGAFASGFALLGLAMSVGCAANQRYLMDIAPRGAVQGSILAANVAAGALAFAPFGVAWLLGRYDLERLLWGGIGVTILALLASGLLIDARVRIRTAPGAIRSRARTPRPV